MLVSAVLNLLGRDPQGGLQIIFAGPQMINLMCNIVFSLSSKQTNITFKCIYKGYLHISIVTF